MYEKYEGERIDKALSEEHGDLTRSYIGKLIEDGHVTVNGKAVKASYKLRRSDKVEIVLPQPKSLDVLPEEIALDIVFEDDSVIVINKPAGMVVHPAAGNYEGTLVNALLSHCGEELSAINGVVRPGIVHRIDKDTTGLLIVAKGDKAHKSLAEQLKTRELKRRYFALVHGNIKEDFGTVSTNIARSPSDRKKMAVCQQGGREAVTNFEVLERFGKYTFVACDLDTGRTHQIRVHMKHIGHPILGDKTYGIKKEEFNLGGQLLHAGRIGFIHPVQEKYMEFSCPLPEVFDKILEVLRKRMCRRHVLY